MNEEFYERCSSCNKQSDVDCRNCIKAQKTKIRKLKQKASYCEEESEYEQEF